MASTKMPLPPAGLDERTPRLDARRDLAPSQRLPRDEIRLVDPMPLGGADPSLSSWVAQRAASLGLCRVEIARTRRVPATKLPDEMVHLRLWMAADGRVSASTVSATGALGTKLLDCVKREVATWSMKLSDGARRVGLVDVNVKLPKRGQVEVQPAERGAPAAALAWTDRADRR